MNRKMIMALLSSAVCFGQVYASDIWRIGTDDGAAAEFALAPSGYEDFLAKDFGYEDRYYLIGYSDLKSDFPYVLPGSDDTWGGTWGTAGWRTHDVNILFKLDEVKRGNWKLVVDLVDSAPTRSVIKVKVNDKEKKFEIKGGSADVQEIWQGRKDMCWNCRWRCVI